MIEYSKADISDFLSIAELDRNAWKSNRNSAFIPDGEHVWRLWVEHALVFVTKENGAVVGAILAFPCASGEWCVHKVMVCSKMRGQGLGSSLFELLLAETDKMGVDCFLTVDPVNANAIKLYGKWGFSGETVVKGFYRANEDRVILTRKALKN